MKKLLLLSVSLILGVFAHAQIIPGFSIGPKIGASFTKFTTDQNQIKEEMKSTFHFGAFARIGKKVYFQPELLVMSRKGELKIDQDGSIGKIKVSSLDVPLLVGFRLVDLKVINVRAMAGPVASMVINKNVQLDEDWNEEFNFAEDNLKDLNWGFQAGAGVDLLMFTLDLRYELGLNNISDLKAFDLKNNMFTVSLGWKIL
ncbi:MAG: porin family protein [Bacteroidota bacterium]